ncbi:chitobiase/beta-hexosaminidase C-terminal domain-containing protein [bacterium]|nr:chitobiase/beta-hexosaminidase C-terminal domain-containing protein [bacterium]
MKTLIRILTVFSVGLIVFVVLAQGPTNRLSGQTGKTVNVLEEPSSIQPVNNTDIPIPDDQDTNRMKQTGTASNSTDITLIAHYPLSTDANDITGNYGPMTLRNTPFQDGGIYCNGIYSNYEDPSSSNAVTPNLNGLTFDAFSISAQFKVDEYRYGPVFVGGDDYRWMGFILFPDSTVTLKYNNFNDQDSNVHYSLNTWHEATVTYEADSETGKLYLDDTLACTATFQINHGYDREVGISDYSTGFVFKGIFRDLKIYNGVIDPSVYTNNVAIPTFNPPPGTYSATQDVIISCATPDATIYYTTDGSDPTESDAIYSSPIHISSTTTLKARAYKSGLDPSYIAGGEYILAAPIKYIRVGKMWAKILDSGSFSEDSGTNYNWYYTRGAHTASVVRSSGTRFGAKDWIDENGNLWSVKLSGAPYRMANNTDNWFGLPYPGEENLTIKRFYRYQPPTITVDGFSCQNPFPQVGDEVNTSQIPGTADVMIESYIRNWMGLEIRARSFGWSQKHHDDYVIYDWLITNTGNVDRDVDIELNTTITDLFLMRQQMISPNSGSEWSEYYGENISDTSRIMYSTPTRRKLYVEDRYGIHKDRVLAEEDSYDQPGQTFVGEGTLFVQRTWNDPIDDPSQPRMHCVSGPDDLAFWMESSVRPESDWFLVYTVMQEGYRSINPCLYMNEAFPEADVYPNTAHDVELPKRGKPYLEDFSWWYWHQVASSAAGPWDLPIGESIRYVWAIVGGALKPEIAWQVYYDWDGGICTWPEWEAGGANDLGEKYPTFNDFPEVSPTANDQAKDRWVVTGMDSLLMNNYAAQWAVQNDYDVPIPPPPPSIEVLSLPNAIRISWGSESEAASDFAGYRVYRAEGSNYYHYYQGIELGKWEMIYEVTGSGTHSYDDITAMVGKGYYYYVTAFDDGIQNSADVYSAGGEVLESGRFTNMTTVPAYLATSVSHNFPQRGQIPTVYGLSQNYPNPFNPVTRIQYQLPKTSHVNLGVYNLTGQEVVCLVNEMKEKGIYSVEWDGRDSQGAYLPSGIYIYQIKAGEFTESKKLILSR